MENQSKMIMDEKPTTNSAVFSREQNVNENFRQKRLDLA